MVTKRVKFTFPHGMITQPVIYNLGQKFNIITNIRRADIRDETGWVVLELEGPVEEIETALTWVVGSGVRIDPVGGDVIEG